MEISIDQTHWYDRIWASLIFFTRLPFWRLHEPPKECYKTVVEHWPLVGWLTGGAMAAILYFGSMVLPYLVVVGGGGRDRQRILDIMKDSRIGTYGVLGLVFYELLLGTTLYSLTPELAALVVFAADPYSKMVTSQLILMLPYARKEEEAKSKTVYRKMEWKAGVSLAVQGLLPMAAFLYLTRLPWTMIIFMPCLVMYFLYLLIRQRLQGYTGDCCGAVCLLVELTVYLVVCSLVTHPLI